MALKARREAFRMEIGELRSPSQVLSPCSQSEPVDANVQLPKLNLPTFSSNYEDWPGFADQFQSGVYDKPRLTNSKKLTYLRSCLKGDALRDIESLKV